MKETCVICNKPIDPHCQWSACVLANKMKSAPKVTSTYDDVKKSPDYDGKFYPEWQQEIDQFTGRH